MEAQFGDFVNAAQVVIDQFLAASEVKWDQPSDLVLLLPHGDEGQGPEHSSACVERFLELCAEDNMCVANVTTAAQLFHILRRQVFQPFKLLGTVHTEAVPPGTGSLQPGRRPRCRGFPRSNRRPLPPEEVRRVVLATGKVALDLLVAREDRGANDVAIVRVEQLYPWPGEQIAAALSRYGRAVDVVWAQEEPANMGAWEFAREPLGDIVPVRQRLTLVSRPPSGSPATGSHTMHELEQADVVERALGN